MHRLAARQPGSHPVEGVEVVVVHAKLRAQRLLGLFTPWILRGRVEARPGEVQPGALPVVARRFSPRAE